jgi:hypothetical protein
LETGAPLIGPQAGNPQITISKSVIRFILQAWDDKTAGRAAHIVLELLIKACRPLNRTADQFSGKQAADPSTVPFFESEV